MAVEKKNTYLSRFIDEKLLSWKDGPSRMPLLLRGARQVGKTESVRRLGNTFDSFVEINFEREPELTKIFDRNLDPTRILRDIEGHYDCIIKPKDTLLFFDEIQECSKAISSLRYFYEEMPSLHVIAAGSLLEFVIDHISFPVGRVESEYLYPLCFSEFLMALGEKNLVSKLPRPLRKETVEVPSTTVRRLRERLREYFIVGGMPHVVYEYKEKGSYTAAGRIQNVLVESFQNDMRKYARGDKQLSNCEALFSRIFGFVGRELTYSNLLEHDDYRRTKLSLQLMEQAMILHLVKNVQGGGLPLGAEASDKHLKLVFLDIGLGQRLSGVSPSDITHSENLLHLYQGRLAEQFVGQELLAQSGAGSENRKLFHWVRPEKGSTAEVDYLLSREGKIYPVEVKSGKSGRLKSLHLFLQKFGGTGICLQDTDAVSQHENIIFAPLYSVL